nr:hypothetical protein CFP56_68693 [Quercus suber]
MVNGGHGLDTKWHAHGPVAVSSSNARVLSLPEGTACAGTDASYRNVLYGLTLDPSSSTLYLYHAESPRRYRATKHRVYSCCWSITDREVTGLGKTAGRRGLRMVGSHERTRESSLEHRAGLRPESSSSPARGFKDDRSKTHLRQRSPANSTCGGPMPMCVGLTTPFGTGGHAVRGVVNYCAARCTPS